MPVYEFYCSDCHTVYNFWSQRINTDKIPGCPKCDNEQLERVVSKSAIISGGQSEGDDEFGDLPIDETKMEEAMMSLASEAENMNEDDPRSMAQFMRKFADKTGLKYNEQMEEALGRLESGEDPDKIEEEMGDIFDEDEMPFEFKGKKGIQPKVRPLRSDPELYDL